MSFFAASVSSPMTNVSANREPCERLSEEFFRKSWPKWTFQMCLALIGIVGNTLIILSFARKLKTDVVNYYILCLAAVDLFACCVPIPLHVFTTANYFSFPDPGTCKVTEWLRSSVTASSSIILAAMAIDRYLAVCKPFTWRKLGPRRATVILGICLLMGLFWTSPLLPISGVQYYLITPTSVTNYGFQSAVFSGLEVNESYIYVCEILNMYHDSWESKTVMTVSFIIFVLLVTTTMASYSAIYVAVRRHMRNREYNNVRKTQVVPALAGNEFTSNTGTRHGQLTQTTVTTIGATFQNSSYSWCFNENASEDVTRTDEARPNTDLSSRVSGTRYKQYRSAKTLLVVTVLFLVSWIPFWIQALITSISPLFVNDMYSDLLFHILWDFFRELYFLNNAFNALVFYVHNTSFRQYCKDGFSLNSCRQM